MTELRLPRRRLAGRSLDLDVAQLARQHPWMQTTRRFLRNVTGMVGLLLVLVVAVASLGAPWFTRTDPTAMDTSIILQTPSRVHPFGVDDLGRDVFSRVLYGGRISILVGVSVALATTVGGVLFGVLAGFYPRLDNPIMRIMDIVMAFPAILLALGIVAILGPQLANIIIALSIPYTPRSAARSIGVHNWRIILRHLLPNFLAPLMVQQTYVLAIAILEEAELTFLGVGVPPSVPTLGGIISDARTQLRVAPWLPLYPGLTISALVLGFNLLGDGLRDVLDPRMKL
jgi:peptide/nickel transport system permease protein